MSILVSMAVLCLQRVSHPRALWLAKQCFILLLCLDESLFEKIGVYSSSVWVFLHEIEKSSLLSLFPKRIASV
jgi:hypothetical protein